jgi:YidC/Oxa1 family membrane protein insertase
MDNQRLLVWATFGLLLWLTYDAWMRDYGPKPAAATPPASQEAREAPAAADSLPELSDSPQLNEPPAVAAEADAVPGIQPGASDDAVIHIVTDVLDIEINTRGGTLQQARILGYPIEKDRPDEVVELLSTQRDNLGLIQTGLRSRGDGPEANQNAIFSAPGSDYRLSGDELVVPLTWTDEQGVTVVKQYRFTRGSYRIDVLQTVSNDSSSVWQGAEYAQLHRRSHEAERSMFDVDSYSYDGVVFYNGEKSAKLDHDDLIEDGAYQGSATAGWVASIQHHFLNALVPPPDSAYDYGVAVNNGIVTARLIGRTQSVSPGDERRFETTLFVGPKLQSQLESIEPSLTLTVDYGWLTIISDPLFWLLSKVHTLVQNWGLAIILVTVLIKLAFYRLTAASGRSMAKMRKIQPRMKALQERYKDDRQQLSQAMMELYKREKVNPAAGCLPILIQMPFFLAFYWVLLESVEMRQAPFALWITDLSSKDPYFILPIIMGAAMLFQQKLNPAPGDPVQAKVMQIMPIVFTGFFAFFPSGLVLYWVTNTVLSIAQQWRINNIVEAEDRKKRGSKKKAKSKGGSD